MCVGGGGGKGECVVISCAMEKSGAHCTLEFSLLVSITNTKHKSKHNDAVTRHKLRFLFRPCVLTCAVDVGKGALEVFAVLGEDWQRPHALIHGAAGIQQRGLQAVVVGKQPSGSGAKRNDTCACTARKLKEAGTSARTHRPTDTDTDTTMQVVGKGE